MAWLILIAIIVFLLLALMYSRSKTLEGFGEFYDTQKTFGDSQITKFQDTMSKAIFTNPGVSMSFLNDAVQQPELYLPKSPDRKYDSFFKVDPVYTYEKENNLCKQAKHPRDLPKRFNKGRSGCGWYFVPNPTVSSVGLYGNFIGPAFQDNLPPNGEWVWDTSLAAKKEDIKFCKKFTTCDALHIPEVREKCAFCPSEGRAIPITAGGAQKYPDAPDGSCGQELVRTPDDCNKPPAPEPVIASNGVSCGTLGRASNDNSIRVYTKEECDTLGGNFAGNGECLVKTGGSYSWDCRSLNDPPAPPPTVKGVCSPNAAGHLTQECFISLAKSVGFTNTGGLLKLLTNPSSIGPNDIEKLKMGATSQEVAAFLGFTPITFGMSADGSPADVALILNRLNKIYSGMNNSSPIISGFAKWLAVGGVIPDGCAADPKSRGPFEKPCLQQAFRMAGCQASGKAYPQNPSAFANKSWAEIQASFSELYDKMKSSDSAVQDKAVSDCLGIQYYRTPPPSPSDSNYEFVQGMDSGGNDIGNGPANDIAKLKSMCDANASCKGFNTNGWLKHTLSPRSYWGKWTDEAGKGTYVKKESSTITACGVNSNDQIYCNTTFSGSNPTGEWKMLPGSLKHIAVNKNKVFGANKSDAIYGADDHNNAQWVNIPGSLKQVSSSENVVCGANLNDDIYCNDNGNMRSPNWSQIPGKLKHVTVNKGKLYGANSNDDIYIADNYKNVNWTKIPGKLKQISADGNVVCGVNSGNEIYCADNDNKQSPNWQRLPGSLKYVAVKGQKLVGVNSNDQIYTADNYKNPNWKQIPGALKQVEIG